MVGGEDGPPQNTNASRGFPQRRQLKYLGREWPPALVMLMVLFISHSTPPRLQSELRGSLQFPSGWATPPPSPPPATINSYGPAEMSDSPGSAVHPCAMESLKLKYLHKNRAAAPPAPRGVRGEENQSLAGRTTRKVVFLLMPPSLPFPLKTGGSVVLPQFALSRDF